MPNIMNRISAHRKALGAVLFTGLAQRHSANPAVGLKIEKIYGNPVLIRVGYSRGTWEPGSHEILGLQAKYLQKSKGLS